jgi:hypothetical protein
MRVFPSLSINTRDTRVSTFSHFHHFGSLDDTFLRPRRSVVKNRCPVLTRLRCFAQHCLYIYLLLPVRESVLR